MGEPAIKLIPGVAVLFFASIGVAVQREALGASMVAPAGRAVETVERPLLVAAVAQGMGGDAVVQEVRSTGVGPQAGAQEARSVTREPSRKQRRRKPKMAEVPPGTPVAAQVLPQTTAQTAAQTAAQPAVRDVPKVGVAGESLKADDDADPFASSKPQTAAQKTEETDPFAASKPGAATAEAKSAPATKPTAETKPAKGGKRYAMAPIRWAARISETLGLLRESRTETGSSGSTPFSILTRKRNFTNIQSAEIKLSSYVMQPYIALVNGGIGVLSSKENIGTVTTSNGVSGGNIRSGNRDNKLFGNGALSMFARSRFPFTASLAVTDSRAGQELSGEETTIKSLTLQQNYRPPIGPSRYSLGYQLNSTEAQRAGNYSYSALNGTYSTRVGSEQDQPLYSSMRHTVSKSRQGGGLTTDILAVQHTYLPTDSLLSLKNHANFTRTGQADEGQQSGTRARFMQLSSVASWQPEDEDVPLFLTGTGRYFRAVTSAQGSESATTNIGGNVSAFYDASTNLKLNADASVTRSLSRSASNLITTQSGTATYRSDNVKMGNKSSYLWTANGGATNQTGGQFTGGTGFNPRAFAGIGHILSGPLDVSFLGKVTPRYSVGQDASINLPMSENAARITERVGLLRNSAGLSTVFGGERLSGSASATVADTKAYGGLNAGHTREFALNIGGQGQQPIYEGYGAKVDASMQTTRAPDGRVQASGALVGTYAKYNIFGVRGLRYQGKLDVTAKPATGSGAASVGTNQKPLAYALDQYLSYRVGQNEARLTAYLDDKNGVKRASLYLQLRAWRTIGN